MQSRKTGGKLNVVAFLKNLWLLLLLVPVGVLVFAGTVAAQVANNEYAISVQLKDYSELEVEFGTEFIDPGAEAFVSGTVLLKKPESLDVTVSGYVDTDVIGTYLLVYSAEFGDISKTALRTVYVVDTSPPVISLITDPDAYTLPGHPYEEEGFTAYDAYDGDITDRVQRIEKDGTVHYYVKDSSGNVASVTREIVYNDKTPPVLTLVGSKNEIIYQGSTYQDPGCTATDDCAEITSSRITVSGEVDTNRVGSYVLTYQAEDDFGNVGEVQRVVHVVKPQAHNKIIYLTFDDGPSKYTGQLLDVLEKYHVKATFFLVNTSSISTASRIVEEGHSVGIHSMTHEYKEIYASEEAFLQDLYGMQELIRQHTGITTYLMRFPGGSSNKVSSFNPGIMSRLVDLVEAEGFRYYDWNVDSEDISILTSEKIAQNVIKEIKSTTKAVVLQHDIYTRSVDAVETIIRWGLENGYTFAALDYASPSAHHGVNN